MHSQKLRAGLTVGGPVLAAFIGLIPPLNAQVQPVQLKPIGGPGGGAFNDACPPRYFLTGLVLHTGDDVDAVERLCMDLHLHRPINSPKHGGSGGGNLKVLLCPPERPAIVAMDVGAEGQATFIVNNIHVYCAALGPNPQAPRDPDAAFDGPPNQGSGGLLAPFGMTPVHDRQSCPPGLVALGINGRSGVWLDAIGLTCGAQPDWKDEIGALAGRPPVVVGRVKGNSPPAPAGSLCDLAAAAHTRKSPSAPYADEQCKQWLAQMAPLEQKDLEAGPSGIPPSVCEAAAEAGLRGAPETRDLDAKCKAEGGLQIPTQTMTAQANQYALQGEAAAAKDPLLVVFRSRQAGATLRGFDIGVAVTGAQTGWGAGKQNILDSIPVAEREGFRTSASFLMDRNRNAKMAAIGASIAAADSLVGRNRQADPDVRYWLGYDIASALFGPTALGGEQRTARDATTDAIRGALSPVVRRGFDASVQLHLSRHY